MFYRTITTNIGWEYAQDPTDWYRHNPFTCVDRVSNKLAEAIANALDTAEQLGYFLYPAGAVKGIGMHTCAEALFLAKSENDITKIMSEYRNAVPQDPAYKLGRTYYENCRLANHVFRPVMGTDFPAWLYNC